MLTSENRQLFSDQVVDHIAKLNALMEQASGESLGGAAVQKVCFAGRLLEGSTRLLELTNWSGTLALLRELLEKSTAAGRTWDEHISQIVSEVLEAEEQSAAAILAGDEEEIEGVRFDGLRREIELLLTEPFECAAETPAESVRIEGPRFAAAAQQREQESDVVIPMVETCAGADSGAGPENKAAGEADEAAPAVEVGAAMMPTAELATIQRLQGSLCLINDRLEECLLEGRGSEDAVRDLELAIGECEFFVTMLGHILGRIGDKRKPLRSKVSSAIVMDGLKDFIGVHGRLRGWRTQLQTRADEVSLEREAAADLVAILDNFVYDICAMSERNGRKAMNVKVDVASHGSWLMVHIFDDAGLHLRDIEIDREDEMAYYQGLLKARSLLSKWGALVWVEPGGEGGERFRFTFPRTTALTDYQLFDAAGMTFAVPRHGVDCLVKTEDVKLVGEGGGRWAILGGRRIPVCRLDELAADEIAAVDGGDHLLIIGLAEKRLGIYADGPGHKVEGLIEQVTENGWASLSRRLLHMGEREHPVLDVNLLLDRYVWLQGPGNNAGETGSWGGGEECTDEETLSRA